MDGQEHHSYLMLECPRERVNATLPSSLIGLPTVPASRLMRPLGQRAVGQFSERLGSTTCCSTDGGTSSGCSGPTSAITQRRGRVEAFISWRHRANET